MSATDGMKKLIWTRMADTQLSFFKWPFSASLKKSLIYGENEHHYLTRRHSGVRWLVPLLRICFWIISSRRSIAAMVGICIACHGATHHPEGQKMAPLGVGFCGTFDLTLGKDKTEKNACEKRDKLWTRHTFSRCYHVIIHGGTNKTRPCSQWPQSSRQLIPHAPARMMAIGKSHQNWRCFRSR